jgi:hypothetical protein
MMNDATTLASAEAAQLRVNGAMRSLSSTIEGGLVSGLTDITMGTKTAGQGFKDMGLMVVKALDEMIIKMMVVGPLMRGLQGMFGFSTYTAAPTVGTDGLAAMHHTGGIVGGDSMPTRSIHPAYFDDAPRFHTGGIAGDEVPIIAKKGEGVFTQGQMAAMGGGGSGPVNVSFAPVYNVTGNSEDINALRQQMAQDQASFAAKVVMTIKKAKTNRVL